MEHLEEAEEEMKSVDEYPHVNYRGIRAMPFVMGNETFEKLGTTGTLANFLVYLITVFHFKTITAATLINIFYGTTNLATLLGAFLSDTYLGRYTTLAVACVASFLGMLVITLTAAIPNMHPPDCVPENAGACSGPTAGKIGFLISGLVLLVIGAGGIRPCNLAFGGDQFNPETESGKKGISSFFNWYYFSFSFAMMISLTVIVYVQSDVSWAWGLGIPALMMFFSCVLFFMGTRIYVKVKPDGSILTSVVQVIVVAIKKRKLKQPEEPWLHLFNHIPARSINSKLPYTDQFRFLNKAAIVTPEDKINAKGSATNPWRLCSLQQVEEVKCLARVIPIWASSLLYYVALSQQQTYVVFQALQSKRTLGNTSFKIPAASYSIFSLLSLTIWIPIYDRILVHWLGKFTKKEGGITILQKMGVGMVLGIATMLVAGLVEDRRRDFAFRNPIATDSRTGGAISSLSGMWLVPQLTLVGISEAFTVIAHIEFYYKQFPENMRSIGGSMAFVSYAVAGYLNGFLISMVHQITKGTKIGQDWLAEDLNEGRLDYFYYFVATLGIINLAYFVVCAKWFKYKGNGRSGLEIQYEFTVIAHIEFYYKQFPENMRSIRGSMAFVSYAVAGYLNGFLISMVHQITKGTKIGQDWLAEDLNEGRLDY